MASQNPKASLPAGDGEAILGRAKLGLQVNSLFLVWQARFRVGENKERVMSVQHAARLQCSTIRS
jgi:hypothetical protein